MAKATALFLVIAALIFLPHTSDGQRQTFCTKSDVSFSVVPTGEVVDGQKTYKVEFSSQCPCEQKGVHVVCIGVENSKLPLDASKVEAADGMCVLKQPIAVGLPLFFNYSAELPVAFRIFKADATCY